MDYYYALLNNYDQLKRRKFKLSLREGEGQEGDAAGPSYDKDEAHKAITGAGTALDAKTAKPTNGVTVWQTEKKGIVSYVGRDGRFTVTLMTGGDINPKNKPGADKLIAMLLGGETKLGNRDNKEKTRSGNMVGGEDAKDLDGKNGVDNQERAIQQAIILQSRMEGLEFKLKDYGYKPTTRGDGRAEAAAALAKKAALGGTETGEGIGKGSGALGDKTIEEKVISSPHIPSEDIEDALAAATRLIDVTNKIGSAKDPDTEQLREAAAQIKITSHGIMFGDGEDAVYIMYRSNSSIETDPFKAMAEKLNDAILTNNKKFSNITDKESQAYKDTHIQPLKEKNKGSTLSKRGPVLESSTVATVLANTLVECRKQGNVRDCAKIEEKLKEQFTNMIGNGSAIQAQDIIRQGLCANADACLVNVDSYEDAIIQDQIRKYLVKDKTGPQLGEEQANVLMEAAARDGDGGVKAMILLIGTTRGYTAFLDGIVVTDATQWGGADATDNGQKDDMRYSMSKEEFEKLKNRIKNNPNKTELEKKLEAAAKCAGEGVGMDKWGTSQAATLAGPAVQQTGTNEAKKAKKAKKAAPTIETAADDVVVPFELKAVENNSSRVKSGEGTSKKFTDSCKGTLESSPLEKEFLEVNKERLEKCGGKLKHDGKTIEEAACDFQKRVNASPAVKAFQSLADGGVPKKDDGTVIEGAGAGYVEGWYTSRKGTGTAKDKATAEKRKELAKAGFTAMEDGEAFSALTADQREAIKKIGLEIEQAQISEQLDVNTDGNGVVTGEGRAYLLARMTRDSGSLEECGKDVRRLGEGEQRVGMINVTTYGGLAMLNNGQARLVRKPGSNSYELETIPTPDEVKAAAEALAAERKAAAEALAAERGEPKPKDAKDAKDSKKKAKERAAAAERRASQVILRGSMERGQNVNEIGKDTTSPIETRQQRNATAHKPTPEETMYSFLIGQKALLEKLIAQTT